MNPGDILIAKREVKLSGSDKQFTTGKEYVAKALRNDVVDVVNDLGETEAFSTYKPRIDCKVEWEIYFEIK